MFPLFAAHLTTSSWQIIHDHVHSGDLDQPDLVQLLSYFSQFLPSVGHHTMKGERPAHVEIRVEDDYRLYVLVEISDSCVGLASDSQLTWVHDDAWANERFVSKPANQGPYLCGALPGKSKFVSLVQFRDTTTKEEALVLLGLKGYPVFDKPGPLYVVTCSLTGEVMEKAMPMVPLIYKIRDGEGAAGSNGGQKAWKVADNFGANTVPGFTSGGSAEVVICTFKVEATDLVELKGKGIECRILLH